MAFYQGRPALNGHFINNGRFTLSRLRINQKRPNGQISRFGLRIADFILLRIRSLSAVRPSHFCRGLANGRLSVAAMAALSTRSGRMSGSLDSSCRWPIAYCPVEVYQQPSQAIVSKTWQSEWPLYQGASRSGRFIKADGCFIKAGKPQWPFYQQWPRQLASANGRFINDGRFITAQANEGLIDPGPLFGGRFKVILFGASLTLARHVQWLHARARLTGGSLRVASSRSPRVCSAPAASGAARRSARRPLTVVRASLGLGFRV